MNDILKSDKKSIYDIAYIYILSFKYSRKLNNSEKARLIKEIGVLLGSHWVSGEILAERKNIYFGVNSDICDSIKTHFASRSPREINLLTNPLNIYLHNELRITTPPMIAHLDYNTGKITKKEEEHYLEMRACYTIDNLCDYYIKKGLDCKGLFGRKRIIGALKWLLAEREVEDILFMIDAVVYSFNPDATIYPLKSPTDLKDHAITAKKLRDSKLTFSKSIGDDKIVPRKRVLSN